MRERRRLLVRLCGHRPRRRAMRHRTGAPFPAGDAPAAGEADIETAVMALGLGMMFAPVECGMPVEDFFDVARRDGWDP